MILLSIFDSSQHKRSSYSGILWRPKSDAITFGQLTCRLHVVLVGVAHDQKVVPASEGVLVKGARDQERIRVMAVRLPGGAAVEVPYRQICRRPSHGQLMVKV